MTSSEFDLVQYEAGKEWLRENHRAQVSQAYTTTSAWFCSCGAGDPRVTMPHAVAVMSKVNHLRAQERKFDREFEADRQAYLEHLRHNGEVEDAKDMSR